MTTYYLGSSAYPDYRVVKVLNFKAAKRAASTFYGVAGCGYLTVSVLICERTDQAQFVELARRYGFDRWQNHDPY